MSRKTFEQTLEWSRGGPTVEGFYLVAFPTQSSLYNLGDLPSIDVVIVLKNGKIHYHDESCAGFVSDPRMVWAWLGDAGFMDADPTEGAEPLDEVAPPRPVDTADVKQNCTPARFADGTTATPQDLPFPPLGDPRRGILVDTDDWEPR